MSPLLTWGIMMSGAFSLLMAFIIIEDWRKNR